MAHSNGHSDVKSLEERIASRAYEKWVRRGRPPGDGVEDWYAARAEIALEQEREDYNRKVALYE